MCGIAGILHFDSTNCSSEHLTKMANAIAHRGPNAEGFFLEGPLGLAHRRLSVIDLSTAANQPFITTIGNQVNVFNGEVYNFRELHSLLPGFNFKTSGDTEVVAELFASLGTSSLEHFKGMFAFAQWDKTTSTLYLVRDRMGVKPLYYYADDSKLVFSSELRSILASGLVSKELDSQAIYDYLRYQSVQEPATLIKGIRQLSPGHCIKVHQGILTIQPYWSITQSTEQYDYSSEAIIKKQVREKLEAAVRRRLVSDVSIGAFLSGGIDSSAVVGLMASQLKTPVSTFNISFAEEDFDESIHAERVSRRFNTLHHRIVLPPSTLLEELEHALDAMDSPTGDGINTYVVSQAVKKEGLTVALSGVGGDELFAGYPFFWNYLKWNRFKNMWPLMRPFGRLAAKYLSKNHPHLYNASSQLLNARDTSVASFYPITRGILSSNQLDMLTHLSGTDETLVNKVWNQEHFTEFPVLSQISMADLTNYTTNTLLKDTDQMSMAVALEVREPFFDHSLVEYVLGVPDQYKMGHSPKSLLVSSLSDLLPKEIVHRKKQGFTFPWSIWMRNELKLFCEEKLKKISNRSFINGPKLMDYWKEFLQGNSGIRWMELWLFVVLEYWLEKNVDG
jgi:asparagine synthase (glutamine-hydrolysing)